MRRGTYDGPVLRSYATPAAAAIAAALLLGCTTSTGPAASAPRLTSPTPALVNPADSKAADFRTRLDLLLGEHVFVIAKQASAAGRTGGTAEYMSYLRLLTANGDDLTELVRSALGDSAAAGFDQVWSTQNDYLVNYTIGLVTHNASQADGAMSGLTNTFVPQFSQLLSAAAQVPPGPIKQLATGHALQIKSMIDDQVAQSYPRMYADLRVAYAQASRLGDALAPNIARRFPDKFPGNAMGPAVDLRVSMNSLLQERQYLATMATRAVTGGRASERAAAVGALAGNAAALGALVGGPLGATAATRFQQVWTETNTATIGYASATTSSGKQSALGRLGDAFVAQLSAFAQDSTGLAPAASRQPIQAQLDATVTVIDDQRSGAPATLGGDDRSADGAMETVADLIAGAVVAKAHAKFGV